jgi:RNA recognition motif-containing protein
MKYSGLHSRALQVHIPMDSATKTSKGMAYVSFARAEDAVRAYDALDSTSFQGRLLHLLPAVGRAAKSSLRSDSASTLKEERLESRKKNAGQSFSWGTLYLNVRSLSPVPASLADHFHLTGRCGNFGRRRSAWREQVSSTGSVYQRSSCQGGPGRSSYAVRNSTLFRSSAVTLLLLSFASRR